VDLDEIDQLIEDCEHREGRLTDREREFIDSIGKQRQRGAVPTKPQAEWLESIWERVTGNG
jgi:hypothetical protein